MAKKRTKTYSVSAVLKVWADVTVTADDLEGAVAASKNLDHSDFVKVLGDHVDSDLRIIGVSDSDWGGE